MSKDKVADQGAVSIDDNALDQAAGGHVKAFSGISHELNAAPRPARSGSDINGDGVPDVIVGAGGPGGHVK